MTHPMWNNELMAAYRRIEGLEADVADLLAACRNALEFAQYAADAMPDLIVDIGELADNLTAAIAKATGDEEVPRG